jgi:hypothetical protein
VIKLTSIKYLFPAIACSVLIGISSCKTTRVATKTATAVKPISTSKLIRNIESNAFEYKFFSVKRMNCQFDNGKTKASFKASIFAEKDKRITVMLTKMNIPVGRLWLTPDSVKFVNNLEKNYFLDDYSYLSSMLDMEMDFETIHAIISNNIFSLREKDYQEYETRIDSGMYVLDTVKKLKSKRNIPKNGERRSNRKAPKIPVDASVQQSIYVDPVTYKLRKIKMVDPVNSRNLRIDFSDFTPIGKQLYPGDISLFFSAPESSVQLHIKLSGFSMEKEDGVRFKVPEKYTRINP